MYNEQTDHRHVSQQSSLLALVLVDQQSQTVGPFGHCLTDTQSMIRRCCCQLFAVRFSWLSTDLWNFSPPRHLSSARPARPAGWPRQQTAPGAAEEALPCDPLSHSNALQGPCLENMSSQIWGFVIGPVLCNLQHVVLGLFPCYLWTFLLYSIYIPFSAQ